MLTQRTYAMFPSKQTRLGYLRNKSIDPVKVLFWGLPYSINKIFGQHKQVIYSIKQIKENADKIIIGTVNSIYLFFWYDIFSWVTNTGK